MAVTLTVDELANALIGNLTTLGVAQASSEAWAEATATRLLPVVTEMVERYAPLAPPGIQNESCIRVAGWLAEEPSDSRQTDSFNVLGVQTTITHTPSMVSPLRASGGMALLGPYKRRHAGSIPGRAATP